MVGKRRNVGKFRNSARTASPHPADRYAGGLPLRCQAFRGSDQLLMTAPQDSALVGHLFHAGKRERSVWGRKTLPGVFIHEGRIGIQPIYDLPGDLINHPLLPAVQEGNIGAGDRPASYRDHPFHRDLGDQPDGDGMVLVDIVAKRPGEIDPAISSRPIPAWFMSVWQAARMDALLMMRALMSFSVMTISFPTPVSSLQAMTNSGHLAALPDPFWAGGRSVRSDR